MAVSRVENVDSVSGRRPPGEIVDPLPAQLPSATPGHHGLADHSQSTTCIDTVN